MKISVNMLLICGIYCVFYVQVPLGILKKCETNHDDMIFILDHLHKYVPITSTTEMVMDPHIGSQIPVEKDLFHRILFGGDMLTTKMARIALHIRENSNRGKVCLEDLIPVVEDWHAKMCLLCVSIVYLNMF